MSSTVLDQVPAFLLGLVVSAIFFLLKRNNELVDKRQKAATKFLAKINECLIDAKLAGNNGSQCICHESYAEFRLTVSGDIAAELEKCWNDYILQQQIDGTRCVECIECLHRIIHKVTKSESTSVFEDCLTCGPVSRRSITKRA